MQASIQPNNAENINESLETGLRLVPVELVAVIPETIWITLTLDQKKEILRQHNLLDKYTSAENPTAQVISTVEVPQIVEQPKNEVIVEQEQRIEKNPDFEQAINELNEANKENATLKEMAETEPVISAEELARIEEEKAKAANTGTYKFFGYQPTQATFANAQEISEESPVSDSKTWAATLIAKIFSLFQ